MITVFGSLNCDLTFGLQRLPIPGETCLCDGYHAAAGGKGGNQAVAAKRAGGHVAMVGCVGRDAFAEVALRGLRAHGVDMSHVRQVDAPTACASICVDARGENAIVVASGANRALRAADLSAALLQRTTTLVTQMEVEVEATAQALRQAHDHGIRTVASMAPVRQVPQDFFAHVSWLLVNRGEAAQLLGAPVDDADIARALHAALGTWCVVTLGADGARAWGPQGEAVAAASAVQVTDTTGAGDAFAGAFACGLDQGMSVQQALLEANAAAGQACTWVGAQPPYQPPKTALGQGARASA